MSSKSETGYAKNMANFKTLNSYLKSLGSSYSPSKASIQLVNLTALQNNLENAMADIQTALPVFSAAVDAHEEAFKPLNKFVTRIVRIYKSSIDNPMEPETAIALQKKISGKPVKAKTKEEPKEGEIVDPVSTSQLSYDNRTSNFQQLVKILAANTDYSPAEPELKVATLQMTADLLKAKTEAVDKAYEPIINGRIKRDKFLYDDKTGVLSAVSAVKNYVIGIYGVGSPQIKYINKLKFK